ncbi:capsule assembly Wzi family protein [Aquirufa sp. ROCK2-A2]
MLNQAGKSFLRRLLMLIFISTFSMQSFAQWNEDRPIQSSISIGVGASSGDYTPFWLKSNQWGSVPISGTYSFAEVDYYSDYVKTKKRFKKKYDFGFGVSARYIQGGGNNLALILPEIYVKGRYGIFEAVIGRKKDIQGLVDSTHSSGSYIWAGNALPVPKIDIVVRDYYYPIGEMFSFKGNFAHGYLDIANQRTDVKGSFLHQKSFYGRIGRPEWPVKLYGGINHQVQWYWNKGQVNLKDYFYIISGQSLAAIGSDTTTYGANDGGNRLGNHLGSVDVGMEVKTNVGKLLMYRQSVYEDGSLYYGNNISDGLHGISFSSNQKQGLLHFTLEYLNTSSQGGAVFLPNIPFKRGVDNYFNNGIFSDGWTHLGRGIGTPFITLDSETDLYKTNKTYFDNNRVEAFYLATEYQREEDNFLLRLSMTNSFGNYGKLWNSSKRQYSLGLQWKRKVEFYGTSILKVNFGCDLGDWLTKNTFGANVSFSVPLYQ